MPRPRMLAPIVAFGLTTAIVPVLAAVALAADPTVIVRPGDTLTAISRRSGVPIARLVELNDLKDPNRILAGQRLRVGVESPEAEPSDAGAAPQTHVVRRGESLWGIARHYGVSLSAIIAANGIADPGRIFGGQRLTIPGASTAASPSAPAASAPAQAVTHTVKRGESLWGIARHYDVSLSAIIAANGIADPGRIFGGQRLTIPGASTAASPASSGPRRAMPAGMAEFVAARDDVRRVIVEEADRHGVPRAFALAVAWQESGWRQGVVSYAGAVGVMQLLPSTAEWVGATMLGTPVDVHATRDNVRAGVRLLAHYLDRYDGNRDLVLAAYYQGQTAADRHGVYSITRPYIAAVEALEAMFGG